MATSIDCLAILTNFLEKPSFDTSFISSKPMLTGSVSEPSWTLDLNASRSIFNVSIYLRYILSMVPQLYSSLDRRGDDGLFGDEIPLSSLSFSGPSPSATAMF